MSANLGSLLPATAARSAEATAIRFGGASISYGELDAEAGNVASALRAMGVGAQDRVALWMGNHPAFVPALYGAWRVGAVVVPLHAMLTAPEVRHILQDSGTDVVFCGHDQLASAGDALEGLRRVVAIDGDGEASYAALIGEVAEPLGSVAEVAADDLALLAYTSGTSGVAKGAMLSHANLGANLDQMTQTPIATRPDDITLCILPLFHIYGLNVVLNLSVRLGGTLVLQERFDARGSIEAIRAERVTRIAGAPPAYVAWLGAADVPPDAFSTVRVAVSGAAPLPKEVLAGFRERFGVTIWEGYGLTETSPALTTTAMGGVAKPGSIGRALPEVEIRLIDLDGVDVEPGDPGEIVVRGPNVFRGYWNQTELTRSAFLDGWFRTGDVAVADDDEDLFLVDRRHDLIIVSGFNVYPREVEDVLRQHPDVGDCAVIGAADPHSGECVHAIVVSDPPGADVTPDEVIAYCRRSLAPYKVPSRIEVTDEIPRNAAGKVLRRALRD